jgi:ectoine hydroxylase-related dioxygenase (phytanoyl-CoA dioxygenase family)
LTEDIEVTNVYYERRVDDDTRREQIYNGDLFVYAPNEASMELVNLAREVLTEGFGGIDPRIAQHHMEAAEYARILTPVKKKFIEHPRCLEIQPRILASLGCNLNDVHFDIPRMRSATSDGYLSSGIAYQFHPHRDTWYSAPMSQINWWIPIFEIEAANAMAFHPKYWDQPVNNNSETYNYQHWNSMLRYTAHQHIKKDTRPQPHALEDLEIEPNVVVVLPPGGMLLFSAAQLHSTLAHNTGVTRYSIDFRTVHRGDLESLKGAKNIDSKCTGSATNDYRCGTDLSRLPQSLQDRYMPRHPQPIEAARPVRKVAVPSDG